MARQPFPVTHLWQEDCGFRKNRMLNKAVVQSRAEYLIFLDGDCIPHRKFVEEHCKARREGFVVAGRRVDLPAALSEGMSVGKVASPGFERKLVWPLLYAGIVRGEKTYGELYPDYLPDLASVVHPPALRGDIRV